jgi:hypothetical protein
MAPARMCRIRNPIAMAASRVFSLGKPSPVDDLPAGVLPRDGSSLADMAATRDCRFHFAGLALVGTRDQMLVLPNNALRLEAPRPMQGGKQSREQPSSLRQAGDDRYRRESGIMVRGVSHRRNSPRSISLRGECPGFAGAVVSCLTSEKKLARISPLTRRPIQPRDYRAGDYRARNAASLTCLRAALRTREK